MLTIRRPRASSLMALLNAEPISYWRGIIYSAKLLYINTVIAGVIFGKRLRLGFCNGHDAHDFFSEGIGVNGYIVVTHVADS